MAVRAGALALIGIFILSALPLAAEEESGREGHQNMNREICRWEARNQQARCYINFETNEELEKAARAGGETLASHKEYRRRINILLYNFLIFLVSNRGSDGQVDHVFITANPVGEYSRENLKIFHISRQEAEAKGALPPAEMSGEEFQKKMLTYMEKLEPLMQSLEFMKTKKQR